MVGTWHKQTILIAHHLQQHWKLMVAPNRDSRREQIERLSNTDLVQRKINPLPTKTSYCLFQFLLRIVSNKQMNWLGMHTPHLNTWKVQIHAGCHMTSKGPMGNTRTRTAYGSLRTRKGLIYKWTILNRLEEKCYMRKANINPAHKKYFSPCPSIFQSVTDLSPWSNYVCFTVTALIASELQTIQSTKETFVCKLFWHHDVQPSQARSY